MAANLQQFVDDALKAKDDQISVRNAKIAEHEATIDQLREQIEALQARIDELEDGAPAPQPEPEPETPQPPSTLMWPKSVATGYKGSLTAYTGPMEITKDGTVIENKRINGTLTVKAKNVIIRNSLVKVASYYGILQDDGSTNLTVENVEVDGTGSSGMTGIAIQAGSTIRRCNIHGMVIGIKTWGSNFTVEDNYIHDLAETSSNPDKRHFDGIANLGASNGIIQRNAIIMPLKEGGTAAVFLSSQQGAVSNVKVLNNLLGGQASYTAYAEKAGKAMSGVVYDGNYIEKGIYGYILNTSGAQDTNNVKWDDATQAAPAEVQAWRAAA